MRYEIRKITGEVVEESERETIIIADFPVERVQEGRYVNELLFGVLLYTYTFNQNRSTTRVGQDETVLFLTQLISSVVCFVRLLDHFSISVSSRGLYRQVTSFFLGSSLPTLSSNSYRTRGVGVRPAGTVVNQHTFSKRPLCWLISFRGRKRRQLRHPRFGEFPPNLGPVPC